MYYDNQLHLCEFDTEVGLDDWASATYNLNTLTNFGTNSLNGVFVELATTVPIKVTVSNTLSVGDKVELIMSDRILKTFIISKTDITKKPELAISALNSENEILILTTCWPFNSQKTGSERYIVTAEKAS